MPAETPTQWQILGLLKANQGQYVSGTQLASALKLTRTAIWKHVRTLRSLGYVIHSHPKEGYRLSGAPDLLIPEEINLNLNTKWLGKSYHYFEQIGSTNDQALVLATREAPHGTVVVAEEQTQGRGRLRRPWLSQRGSGIYMSVLLRDSLPLQDAPQSTLVAALSLVTVLRAAYGLNALMKWPNDVLIGTRKMAGILTEMQSDQDVIRFMVIGIGINVNHTATELTGPFRYPATSIALELGAPIQRQHLLLAFLERFEADYERFLDEGFQALLPELEEASAILGKSIKIRSGKEELTGKALGFTPQGALRLLTENEERIIWVGDVAQVEGTF